MPAAAITGIGVVSALGRGCEEVWSRLAAGCDGLGPIRRFPPDVVRQLDAPLAGMVPDRNVPDAGALTGSALCVELAVDAAREALRDAGLDSVPADRLALVMGTSLGDPGVRLHALTEAVGDALEVSGPRVTASTACTSSTNALGLGLDLLAIGAADLVLAGGADVLTPLVVAGFRALGVLAPGKCAPFSMPAGVSLGEGAAFLALEREDSARARGVVAPFSLLGYGLSADAYHDTGPDPTGAGVARAMDAAMRHASIHPGEVDYVNAHGTGTAANDPAEWRAIQQIFGRLADELPVSSSKSFLGHAQGAAGALEAVATLLSVRHGAIPPTQRFTMARPHGPRDPVAQPAPRPASCRIALSSNSAFGGANCSLVLRRNDGSAPAGARGAAPGATERRPLSVAGLGAIGPHGSTLDALADVLMPARRKTGAAVALDFARAVPGADPRGLDPTTRSLTAAASAALADGGLRVRGAAGARAGLVVGVDRASPESDSALHDLIEARGLRQVSAALFSRMVLNAPAGTASRLLGLKGPTSTLSAGDASGLLAIAYACELLAGRDDADLLVAGAVEELADVSGAPPAGASEVAACAVLRAGLAGGRRVRVAGWAIGGPGHLPELVESLAGRSAVGLTRVDLVAGPAGIDAGCTAARRLDPEVHLGAAGAASSALAFVAAALLVRRGRSEVALAVAGGGRSVDCAVLLVGEDGDPNVT